MNFLYRPWISTTLSAPSRSRSSYCSPASVTALVWMRPSVRFLPITVFLIMIMVASIALFPNSLRGNWWLGGTGNSEAEAQPRSHCLRTVFRKLESRGHRRSRIDQTKRRRTDTGRRPRHCTLFTPHSFRPRMTVPHIRAMSYDAQRLHRHTVRSSTAVATSSLCLSHRSRKKRQRKRRERTWF